MRPLFSDQVLEAVSELLNGYLNLQSATNQNQPPTISQELNRQHPSPHQVIKNATAAVAFAISTQAKTADDFLTQINALLVKKGNEQEVIRLLDLALAIQQSGKAYFYSAYSKYSLGDKEGAIADYNVVIAINPLLEGLYSNRGNAKFALGESDQLVATTNRRFH